MIKDALRFAALLLAATSNDRAPAQVSRQRSSRPDFAIVLYPGHLWSGRGMDLYAFDAVSADCPPTFIVQAKDVQSTTVRNSIAYAAVLKAKKVPVEMHVFVRSGHAFGLRPTAQPITRWPVLAQKWLHAIGII